MRPTINGDGSYSRDFTYIENAVQANILALTTENNYCFGEAFNIGAGGQFSILEMLTIIKKNYNLILNQSLVQIDLVIFHIVMLIFQKQKIY